MESERDSFPLFKAPYEIRNMIYEYALQLSVTFTFCHTHKGDPRKPHQWWYAEGKPYIVAYELTRLTPALLLTSKQIAQETRSILHSCHKVIKSSFEGSNIRLDPSPSPLFLSLCESGRFVIDLSGDYPLQVLGTSLQPIHSAVRSVVLSPRCVSGDDSGVLDLWEKGVDLQSWTRFGRILFQMPALKEIEMPLSSNPYYCEWAPSEVCQMLESGKLEKIRFLYAKGQRHDRHRHGPPYTTDDLVLKYLAIGQRLQNIQTGVPIGDSITVRREAELHDTLHEGAWNDWPRVDTIFTLELSPFGQASRLFSSITMEPVQTTSRLLDLPLEIRLIIYELVLLPRVTFSIRDYFLHRRGEPRPNHFPYNFPAEGRWWKSRNNNHMVSYEFSLPIPPLLTACKQIAGESQLVLRHYHKVIKSSFDHEDFIADPSPLFLAICDSARFVIDTTGNFSKLYFERSLQPIRSSIRSIVISPRCLAVTSPSTRQLWMKSPDEEWTPFSRMLLTMSALEEVAVSIDAGVGGRCAEMAAIEVCQMVEMGKLAKVRYLCREEQVNRDLFGGSTRYYVMSIIGEAQRLSAFDSPASIKHLLRVEREKIPVGPLHQQWMDWPEGDKVFVLERDDGQPRADQYVYDSDDDWEDSEEDRGESREDDEVGSEGHIGVLARADSTDESGENREDVSEYDSKDDSEYSEQDSEVDPGEHADDDDY
ncbi:hypothetical protein BT63DRAFT_413104 [Microthyrium microscopicum]|uniref:F-box domain-containing protein n=1 Tax=Microthyrium microscopicum TaxID=703497 RepID=A0A6A6UF00_9PEZI|nr:hypothetical protein BT63DRAFT_413104 [Microthyrium microscopicum]